MPIIAQIERRYGPPRKLLVPDKSEISILPESNDGGNNNNDVRTLRIDGPNLGHLTTRLGNQPETVLHVKTLRRSEITDAHFHPTNIPKAELIWQEANPRFSFLRGKLKK